MGRILDLLRAAAGESSLMSKLGHWRQEVSATTDETSARVAQIESIAAGEVNALAGPGLIPDGTELAVGQNPDNSVIVNADNIQLNPALQTIRETQRVVLAADINNNTGTYANMAGMAITMSVEAGSRILFWFDTTCRNTSVTITRADSFRIMLDGVLISGTSRGAVMNTGAIAPGVIAISGVVGPLAVGNHTIQVQWRNEAGGDSNLFCRPFSNPEFEGAQLMAVEVR